MGRLPYSGLRVFDSNGDPLNGGKAYWYEAGTTTPLDTYSDDGLSSANANPVVADGDGLLGPMYGSTAEYKLVLKDSSDVTIFTEDNIFAGSLVSSSLTTRVGQIASNPLDEGAIGDGVADEASEVNSAIVNATRVVDLLGKTYRCDQTIALQGNRHIKNGTLDFTSCTDDWYLRLPGTDTGAVVISADANSGATQILTADTSGVAAGDMIFITSTEEWTGTTGTHVGDLVEVTAVVSNTSIDFLPPLESDMLTADSAEFQKINPDEEVVIENVNILCNSAASGVGHAIRLEQTRNVVIRNCEITTPKASGICIGMSQNVLVENCRIDGSAADGIKIQDAASDITIRDTHIKDCVDGIDVGQIEEYAGGVCRRVVVDNCTVTECTLSGFNLIDECQYVELRGCRIIGGTSSHEDGVVATCGWLTIQNCLIGEWNGYGVYIDFGALTKVNSYTNISGCRVFECGATDAVFVGDTNTTGQLSSVSVNDCDFYANAGATRGLRITPNTGTGCANISVTGSRFYEKELLINAAPSASPAVTNQTVVSGCVFSGTGAGPSFVGVNKVSLTGNTCVSGASFSNTGFAAESVVCTGNSFGGTVSFVFTVTGTEKAVFSGNTVKDTQTAGGAVRMLAGYCDSFVVSGNAIENTDSTTVGSHVLDITAAAASSINVIVSGNVIDGGYHALSVDANVGTAIHDGNVFINTGAGGQTTGSWDATVES